MKAMFSALRIEFREACQRLLARPGYTALSVAVLAVGLGATLFVLGAINTLVLQPGPFSGDGAVYQLGELDPEDTDELDELAAGDALNLLRDEPAVTTVALYQEATINIADQKTVVRYDGVLVNSGVFKLLGVTALLGRTLQPDDDRPGAPRVATISYRIWQDRFAGAADIIGRRVRINAFDATIVGVMPDGFSYPFGQQVWFAAQFDPNTPRAEQAETVVLVRVAAGTDLLATRERLNVVWAEIQKGVPSDTRVPNPVEFLPVNYLYTSRHTRMILNLMLVTGFGVLLLACANVAGLQAAQVVARARELSVRAAIGASRGRILFGILCESFILASLAAAIGLVIAHFGGKGVESVFAAAGEAQPYWMHFGVDWRMALMGFGSALLATALAGIMPAWRASGGDVQAGLRDGAKGSAAGTSRLGRILIVFQVALSCLLLVGAGSVYRDLDRLATLDLGIKVATDEVLTGRVAIFPQAFPTPADQVQFFERLGDALRADPEVAAATVSQSLPGGIGVGTDYRLDGEDPQGDAHYAHFSAIDDHFLETYGISLQSGRFFQATDTLEGVRVAVVDQAFVDRHWPGQDAIGRQLHSADGDTRPIEIVGVVPTLHLTEIDDSPNPTVLMSLRQAPSRFNSLSIRARGDVASLARRLPGMVRAVDADTPVYWVRRLDETIASEMVGQRLLAVIFGLFGAVGLLLAAAGIYGLLAQTVANRTREIGVRRAIGASGARVMQQISAGSLTRVGIGLAIGLGLGVPWSRLMTINAEDTWTLDPWLFLIVLVAILLSAMLAIWVPARRALAVDPMTALRHD
ncbi:MAG: ABC transporter permease [Ahniella sp.]|nr:ABC transporter permease [Ahniella sp.]